MNLGWYYYRGYYADFFRPQENMWLTKEEAKRAFRGEGLKNYETKQAGYFSQLNGRLLSHRLDTNATGSIDHRDSGGFALETTYPGLLIGTGYSHETGTAGEFKLGFYFDHTSGLPVIPGSSIKGILRSAFPGFTLNEARAAFNSNKLTDENERVALEYKLQVAGFTHWLLYGEPKELRELTLGDLMLIFELEMVLFESIRIDSLRAMVAKTEGAELERLDVYHRDIFYEATINKSNNPDSRILGVDFITPHRSASDPALDIYAEPVPLQMLKVLPGVGFQFKFLLKNTEANKLGWDPDKRKMLYKRILLTNGAGAKTNTGFGQFAEPDADNRPRVEAAQAPKHQVAAPNWVTKMEDLRKGAKVKGVVKTKFSKELVFELPDLNNLVCALQGYGNTAAFEVGNSVLLTVVDVQRKGDKVIRVSVDRLVVKL